MRIGILGGSFNPIHFGHLRVAEDMRETLGLSKILFVPAKIPPHKENTSIISIYHRFNMVDIAISSNPWFEISDIEIKREGKSYTIETVELLKERFGDNVQLHLIIGIDSFVEINTWKNYKELFSSCNIAVMTRPGFVLDPIEKMLPKDLLSEFYCLSEKGLCHRSGFKVEFVRTTYLDISANKIRENILRGRSVKYLIPPNVEEYIYTNGLYR